MPKERGLLLLLFPGFFFSLLLCAILNKFSPGLFFAGAVRALLI